MMLDVKRTWDDLVTRHAPDPARRERILKNRLYQQMSTALAGSQEYMAMEKLYELATDRDYDLIVLDTPPTAHALDFLDAPDRILDFLGNDAARAFLAPAIGAGKLGLRLAQLGGGYVAKTLARFTGQAALSDLGDFLQGFQGMYEGFKDRAAAVHALLSQPDVGFVLVTSPSPLSIDEALAFHERLHAESMPIAGVVANRVTPDLWPGDGPLPATGDVASALGAAGAPDDGLAGRLAATLAEHQALGRGAAGARAPVRGDRRPARGGAAPRERRPRPAGPRHARGAAVASRPPCSSRRCTSRRAPRPTSSRSPRSSGARCARAASRAASSSRTSPTPPPASPSRRTPIPTCEGTSCSRSRTRCRRGRPPARTATRRGTATRT